MRKSMLGISAICLAATMGLASVGQAIQVTQNSSALDLAAALTQGNTGIQVIGASLSGDARQSGTFTNLSKVYSTVGLDSGIVLSTGQAADFSDGPDNSSDWSTDFKSSATAAQNAMLTPITGQNIHRDAVQLDITFTMDADFNKVFFNMAFGSEEFDEWIGSVYEDGFGIFLNGVNIAYAAGQPISISNPGVTWLDGTELDGVMTAQFQGDPLLNGQQNTLTFILADATDGIYDTTVYLSALGGTAPPPPDDNLVPEPASVVLALTGGLPMLAFAIRRKR